MPCNPNDLFAWCLAQDADTLNGLLAFCVASTVNAVLTKSDSPASTRITHAVQLAEALKLDMTAWFTPTAANYFSKVSKPAIIEAVREATGAAAPAWTKMKKADLAAPGRAQDRRNRLASPAASRNGARSRPGRSRLSGDHPWRQLRSRVAAA